MKLSRVFAMTALLAAAGCSAAATSKTAPPPAPAVAAIPAVPGSLDGAYVPGDAQSWAPLGRFGQETGTTPRILLYYSGWGEEFKTALAGQARAHSAYVLVQMEPADVSLASIAAGKSDAYLRSYAAAVRAFGRPVIIGFAHEMNGGWYQWGDGHTPARVFVAAWRHIVDVFRAEGALNVTWLWTINAVNATSAPLGQWWPGSAYVTWVGIDGYYYQSTDTFSWVFGRTVARVRQITADPILISETGIGPVAGPSKIADLFAGVHLDHLLGLVWFDQDQHSPPYHQAWALTGGRLAAFRAAAAQEPR